MKKEKGKDDKWKWTKTKKRILTVSLVKCSEVFSSVPTESN